MASVSDVLWFLRPNGGWAIHGDDFNTLQFLECEPITKEEFEAAFAQVDALKAEQEADKQAKRQALLDKLAALGLTSDDLKALGL